MIKAYSYVRMSSDAQLKGDSLRRQIEESKSFASKNNLDLVENLQDIGVSAFHGRNIKEGPLAKFLELANAGKIDRGSYLIIESLDRLSRDAPLDALSLFSQILSNDIIIATLQDGQIYTSDVVREDPSKLYISLGVMIRANEESRVKSMRISKSWENKRTDVKNSIITSVCPGWLIAKNDKSGFNLIPSAAAVVKQIFQWSLKGMGALAITRKLNEAGIKPIGRSNTWNISYVKKILANEAVTGHFQPHKIIDGRRVPVGKPEPDYFPQVISGADFIRCQNGIASRRSKGGRKGKKFSNLLSHLAICGSCESAMVYLNKGKNESPILICKSAHQRSGCSSIGWNYTEIERDLLLSIRELNLEQLLNSESSDKEKALSDEIVELENEIKLDQETLDINTDEWLKVDPAIKLNIQKKLVKIQSDIDLKNENLSKLKYQQIKLMDSNNTAIKVNLEKLLIETTQSMTEEDVFLLRSSISNNLSKIISSISVHTDMKIYPSEVDFLSQNLLTLLFKKGYTTLNEIYKLLDTKLGQKLYVEDERYLRINFINGKNAILKPSTNIYMEFDTFEAQMAKGKPIEANN